MEWSILNPYVPIIYHIFQMKTIMSLSKTYTLIWNTNKAKQKFSRKQNIKIYV